MENLKMTLSIEETMQALCLSRPLVMSFIHREDNPLPCIKTGKRYRVPRAALETWIMEEAARNTYAPGKK